MGKQIPILIFDESHDAKKPASKLDMAIRSLEYKRILMLTGTPVHNTFLDLLGQTMLLPGGGIFTGEVQFRSTFCGSESYAPTGWRKTLLHCLYQGLIVARPEDVVKLYGKEEECSIYL
jgi:hypothetical protein